MKKLYRPGIGAVTRTERRGFSEQDQDVALAECKMAQYDVQGGRCILCTKAMFLPQARWISAHGATATLSEWAKAMTQEYHMETHCPVLHHRSPDEIRAEYGNALRGHELACRGCAMRVHYALYGENGAGAAYRKHYGKLVDERRLTEDQQHDPEVVMQLHTDTLSYLGQTRMARLSENWGKVDPDDVKVKPKVHNLRRKKSSNPYHRGTPAVARKERLIGTGPEADAALEFCRAEAAARPETDLERMSRELIEDAALKKGG